MTNKIIQFRVELDMLFSLSQEITPGAVKVKKSVLSRGNKGVD